MDGRIVGAGVIAIVVGFFAGMCAPEEYKPGFVKNVRDDIKRRLEERKATEKTEEKEEPIVA